MIFIRRLLLIGIAGILAACGGDNYTPEPDLPLPEQLNGKWVSIDDPKAFTIVRGQEFGNGYEGFKTEFGPLKRVSGCGLAPGTEELYVQASNADGSTRCYAVLKLTATELEMMFLPRGNVLRFTKTPEDLGLR